MSHKLCSVLCVICISFISWSACVRILPYKSMSPGCRVPPDRETCSLQGLHGLYRGRKYWKSPNKFVMLWPLPYGNYEKVRRLCHACDLEVAEIWDEDDANQILELMKSKNGLDLNKKFDTASFWLGETQTRDTDSPVIPSNEGIQQLRFLHQDGITPVRFHFLRGQKSFAKGYSSSSRLPDDNKDCIVIGPDPQQKDKISWFVQSCRARRNFGLCQFKRKHHCYDEAPVPSTRQLELTYFKNGKHGMNTNATSTVKPQPYYLSNYPLSWALAKSACEKDNKSLLFFDSREEEQFFTKSFGKLLREKEHLEPGLWTAGRFEHQDLRWWIGNNILTIRKYRSNEMKWNFGFAKTQGRTMFRNKTTLESSRGEGCVYFESSPASGKWGIADCQKSMRFFVCKDAEVEFEKKSSVEYCDGKSYVMKERFDCKWNLVLKKQKPKCVCVEGVHGLTDHASCNSRLLIGPKCIQLNEKGVVHWKILSRSLIENDAWLIVQLRGQESGRFIEWFGLQQNSSRQLFGSVNMYYSGLKAIRVDKSRICFQKQTHSTSKSHFYELKIRNLSGTINYASNLCPFGTSLDAATASFKVHKIQNPKNECNLEPCSKPPEVTGIASLVSKSKPYISEQIPEEAENSIRKLNEKMLAYKIDKAFGKAQPIANDPGPMWMILNQIMEIVKRLCSCLLYNGEILDEALELFHVAHSGQEYRYVPSFTESEASEILSMLEKCSRDFRLIACETNNCTGRALKVSDRQTRVDDSGLQGSRHHHILEFVWLAVSSVNVACVKHFKASYLAFHHLEQSLENLFTEEMKKLWHYPSVDPNYFQMLLGPTEATDLVNMKSCASAVQGINPKMMELLRPKQAKGRNLAERIHARKVNDRFEAQGYDALSKNSRNDQESTISTGMHSTNNVFCSRDEYCLKW